MNKIACLIFLLIFSFSTAFGLSDNEIKYKWNKLDLVTKYKSGVTATWSEYKSKYYETGGLRIKPEGSQDIEDWYVTKGGEKVSEVAFLKIIGEEEKAKQIEFELSIGWPIAGISYLGVIGGVIHWFLNSTSIPKNETEAQRGVNIALGSLVVGLLNPWKPLARHISYSEAGYKIDLYNENLKKELGAGE